MGKLEIKNLRFQRSGFELLVPELTVERGKILGVMGKSGCGKSTLLNLIAGFEMAQAGTIQVEGNEISHLPPEKRKVAIVFQKASLFPHLTVLDNVCFGLKVKKMSKEEQIKKGRLWLEKLDISKLADRYPEEISGGEAQRVALARSVVVEFPVLLLDEPFSALDSELKSKARGIVREIVNELKLATLLVSHDPEDISVLADQKIRMEAGKLQAFS